MELVRSIFGKPNPDVLVANQQSITPDQRAFHFAMGCNGYYLNLGGHWIFDQDSTRPLVEKFRGTRISFFGPNQQDKFFSDDNLGYNQFVSALGQKEVTETIKRLRQIDETQATRVAFILGGLVRHLASTSTQSDNLTQDITDSVGFVSNLTRLGRPKSAEAIAAAMSMYVISGGKITQDESFKHLKGSIYHMAEAIDTDPITPSKTMDLGLSQFARLRHFFARGRIHSLPNISKPWESFDGFPTVGAEFHFPKDAPKKFPNFWQRLAILNMSQYQTGSFIQLSRNDRDVIEVRINPSVYPAAIANWNQMRLLLPELNKTYFTTTLNRNSQDFFWKSGDDLEVLETLRSVGMLCYAGSYKEVPPKGDPAEIPFGSIYLGQTVKLDDGRYSFTGNWSSNQGESGQLGIYSGLGDNFPYLAYNLSMVLAEPNVLGVQARCILSEVKTLDDALNLRFHDRIGIFHSIKNRIESDPRLRKISDSGRQIMESLNP